MEYWCGKEKNKMKMITSSFKNDSHVQTLKELKFSEDTSFYEDYPQYKGILI